MSLLVRNFSARITAPCNTLRTLATIDFRWRKNCWWRRRLFLANATARKRATQPQQEYVTLNWWQQHRRHSHLFRCNKIFTTNVPEQIPSCRFSPDYGIGIRFILYKNIIKLRQKLYSDALLCVRFSTRQHISHLLPESCGKGKIHEQIWVKANERKTCGQFYVYYGASNELGISHTLCIQN
jgi:hypothetical protein